MKTISVSSFGGPEQLQLMERPLPQPARGEAVVKIACAGINFIDVYMRNGSYAKSHTYQTPLPMTLGMEGVGRIAALGEGVTGFAPGERVGYYVVRGAYAEYAAVPAWRLVKLPENISFAVATALMLQGATAHYLSHSAFPLANGHTCLVHAAAGGVGQLLTQLAKLRGATVIATVGSADKAQTAKACGADHVIDYRELDFRDEVRRITAGAGVDVVYDAVGKDTISRSIRSLKRRGYCINYGGASGLVQSIEPLELAEAGSVFFTRPHLADYTASADEIQWRARELFDAVAAGKLTPRVDREFALCDASEAHRVLESRGSRGKLLLRIGE